MLHWIATAHLTLGSILPISTVPSQTTYVFWFVGDSDTNNLNCCLYVLPKISTKKWTNNVSTFMLEHTDRGN